MYTSLYFYFVEFVYIIVSEYRRSNKSIMSVNSLYRTSQNYNLKITSDISKHPAELGIEILNKL